MQRQFLRSGKTLASFKLDVATVMQQPGEGELTMMVRLTSLCCRRPVLPQVGSADRSGRHCRQLQGLHQVRHQHHHQGGRCQDPQQG